MWSSVSTPNLLMEIGMALDAILTSGIVSKVASILVYTVNSYINYKSVSSIFTLY